MMVQEDENGEVEKVKFLDFQIIQLDYVYSDLYAFLYIGTDTKFR